MNALLFGATGMIGQGVLRECLLDGDVRGVTTVGRAATGQHHAKLREVVAPDLMHLAAVERDLTGFDVCFFCLGVSSAGMSEADYTRITYDLTLAVAATLVRLNPAMTLAFVSGRSTDDTEQGRSMWARVKGRTENALLRLPFKAAYMFRPGLIVPLHGIKSRTPIYRVLYIVMTPALPLLEWLFPASVTTTERLARAMIAVGKRGYGKKVLEAADINLLARAPVT